MYGSDGSEQLEKQMQLWIQQGVCVKSMSTRRTKTERAMQPDGNDEMKKENGIKKVPD